MANAVVRASWYGGSATEPAGVNAEDTTGVGFNRADDRAGTGITSAIPIPLTPTTVFSWPKLLALQVTTVGTTTISNRTISVVDLMPDGTTFYCQGVSSYVQPSDAGRPADIAGNGGVPAGYSRVPDTVPLLIYDATALSSGTLGRNGKFAQLVLAVDGDYASTGGTSGVVTFPVLRLTYDET